MIYFIQAGPNGPIKIGFTKSHARRRLGTLATASPHELSLIGLIEGDKNVEKKLHAKFWARRIRGEWFQPDAEILAMCGTFADDLSGAERRKSQVTIGIEPSLEAEIRREAAKLGVGWTTMVNILTREALASRKARAA